MANEFKHSTVGSQLSQTEYESTTGHVLDSQAAGDIIYASSTSQLSRLGIGTAGKVLAVNSGASAPEYVAALTGVTSVLNTALVIGRDADNDIDFATDNTILFRADGADQIKLTNGALLPVTDDDIDLGSSSLQFKDGFFDGTLEADAITVGGTAVLTGGAETAITSILNTSLVLGRDADNDIDFGTDNNIIFRAGAADQIKLIDGALAPVTDNDVDLGTSSLEFKDAYFDGTVNTDGLAMGTNTSGNLLVANGSSFASTAVGDLSEISSVAADDVLLAVDTSGGGLKKITRSTLVSGLATSGAISNVVEDTSPELGGDLDVLTHGIVTGASNRNIALTPHGTGVVRIDGSNGVDIESGAISIKNAGAESYVRFYCESSNAHYTQLQASPHSAYSGNVTVVLPAAATNLVGDDTTQTLTNKTLTSPKVNENVAVTATATELNIIDGDTSAGTTAVADGDGIVTNDGGTMRQTTVQTFATYFGSEITNMSNLVETGTLNSGAISSGFGNIDIGSSTFDTTGAVTSGALTAGGILKTDDTTDATSTTDGSLQTDGGLSVAKDAVIGDDLKLLSDSAVLNLGAGNDVTITHDGTTGATITGTPMVYESKGSGSLANDTHSGIVLEFLAGESIAVGDWVYMSTVDGRVSKADANDTGDDGHYPAIGVAVSAQGSAGSAVKILTHGVYNDSDGFGGSDLTEGKKMFLSTTAGAVTATAPSSTSDRVQVCGIAVGPRDVFVNPSLDTIEHA